MFSESFVSYTVPCGHTMGYLHIVSGYLKSKSAGFTHRDLLITCVCCIPLIHIKHLKHKHWKRILIWNCQLFHVRILQAQQWPSGQVHHCYYTLSSFFCALQEYNVIIWLSMDVLNSRDRQGNYGFPNFHTCNNHFKTFAENTNLLHSYCFNNAITLLNVYNLIYNEF